MMANILTRTFYLFSLMLCSVFAMGQTLSGLITNAKNEPLPYVTIYCETAKIGANSNVDGNFKLKLPEGRHQLVFSSIDYKAKRQEVIIGAEPLEIKVVLEEQNYQLKEVEITTKNVDPAVYIMRKVIGAAPYYRRQVLKYNARVYVKGTGKVTHMPGFIKSAFEKSSKIEVGKAYVTESVNEISFSQPSTYREKVISLKSSMPFEEAPQPMTMVRGNIYNTSYTEVVSPLSPQAFSVYDFKLEGSFYENGREINKIKIIPKRKGSDVYEGYLYVVEKLWCLHSCVLVSNSNNGTASVKISFKQLPEEALVWLPVTYDIEFAGGFMGIKGSFRYLCAVSNYKVVLNPNIDHQWLMVAAKETLAETNKPVKLEVTKTKNQEKIEVLLSKQELSKREMLLLASRMKRESEKETKQLAMVNDSSELSIDSLATQKDSSFWLAARPIPLLQEEQASFEEKKLNEGKERKDSSGRKQNAAKTSFSEILFAGDSFPYKNGKRYFSLSSPLQVIHINTVEGIALEGQLSLGNTKDKRWRYIQSYRIPLFRAIPQTQGEFSYRFKPEKRGLLALKGGIWLKDYNAQGITPLIDAFQLIALGNNFSKWYMSEFVEAKVNYELANGLTALATANYAHRYGLENLDYFLQKEGERNYTNNKPFPGNALANHESYQLSAAFEYRPFQTFRMRNNVKQYLKNSWPLMKVKYSMGMDKQLQFQKIEALILHDVNPWHWVNVKYSLHAGKFLNAGRMFEPDRQYFMANQSFVYNGEAFPRFQDLTYYASSASDKFLAFNTQLQFKRLALKHLPYLNLTNWKEALYFNALQSDKQPLIYESGYRLSEILGILSLGVNYSFFNGYNSALSFSVQLKI